MSLFSSQLVQLAYVALLVVTATVMGQTIYRYAEEVYKKVHRKTADRKHPELRYVLYEMFWAPGVLLAVFLFIRIGVVVLPPGTVVESLVTVVNTLVLATFLWLSLRIIRGIITVADQKEEED